eukprot:558694-Hanusia_phi.AAC.2
MNGGVPVRFFSPAHCEAIPSSLFSPPASDRCSGGKDGTTGGREREGRQEQGSRTGEERRRIYANDVSRARSLSSPSWIQHCTPAS